MYHSPGLAATGAGVSATLAYIWYPLAVVALVALAIALWRMAGTLCLDDAD